MIHFQENVLLHCKKLTKALAPLDLAYKLERMPDALPLAAWPEESTGIKHSISLKSFPRPSLLKKNFRSFSFPEASI